MHAVIVCSGGMDSSVLAHLYHAEQAGPLALVGFDYGQRHRRELDAAETLAARLDAEWVRVDLSGFGALLRSSSLTNHDAPVPHGHYADESMRATVVPNRNAIMLSIAWGLAVDRGARIVATGVHAGDHPIYPDCRPAFIESLSATLRLATEGHRHPELAIEAPFVEWSKAAIATLGATLGVDFAATWSCYEGGEVHCGACGTCVERREAFELAGVLDPTPYAVAA